MAEAPALTRDEFNQLRLAWLQRRMPHTMFNEPELFTMSPPQAGTWVRMRFRSDPPRLAWHRANGDLAWRPGFPSASITSMCGVDLGSVNPSWPAAMYMERSRETPPERACRRCQMSRS
jgi:hypothetical protein